jgi:hypothetical protein
LRSFPSLAAWPPSASRIIARVLGRRSRLGAAIGIGASEAICPRRRSSRSSSMACLGRQSQARKFQRVTKAFALSNCHGLAGDRTVTLQCPSKALSPAWGKSVGGVSERVGAKAGESNLSATVIPSRVVAVKDILVFWKAAPFAGGRWNEDLGRSVLQGAVSPLRADAPMTADARRTPRRGTPSAGATKRRHPTQAREIVACVRGRVLHSVLRPVHVNPHSTPRRKLRWWGGREGITVGQARASEREPTLGLSRTDEARLATCHRFRKGEGVTR